MHKESQDGFRDPTEYEKELVSTYEFDWSSATPLILLIFSVPMFIACITNMSVEIIPVFLFVLFFNFVISIPLLREIVFTKRLRAGKYQVVTAGITGIKVPASEEVTGYYASLELEDDCAPGFTQKVYSDVYTAYKQNPEQKFLLVTVGFKTIILLQK